MNPLELQQGEEILGKVAAGLSGTHKLTNLATGDLYLTNMRLVLMPDRVASLGLGKRVEFPLSRITKVDKQGLFRGTVAEYFLNPTSFLERKLIIHLDDASIFKFAISGQGELDKFFDVLSNQISYLLNNPKTKVVGGAQSDSIAGMGVPPKPELVHPPPYNPEPGAASLHIFISYRRSDSADIAGRIYDRLIVRFGSEPIFKDVDSIPLGLDFKEYLDQKVGECDVMLAIIGDRWLEASDATGKKRLKDPTDFVRIEIQSALQRIIPVIPLLVRGAAMPRASELPSGLRNLVYRNGISIRPDPDFHRDMDRLISTLEKYVHKEK